MIAILMFLRMHFRWGLWTMYLLARQVRVVEGDSDGVSLLVGVLSPVNHVGLVLDGNVTPSVPNKPCCFCGR